MTRTARATREAEERETAINEGGRRWDIAIVGLGVAAPAIAALGWLHWPL
jgi:hypothetical protein